MKYIKSNAYTRAVVSRVKYYRRRKMEYLKQRRKLKNFNYFLYTLRFLVRKHYYRIVKFHSNLKKDNTTAFFKLNKLLILSRKRCNEFDEFDDDEEISKNYHSEGLIYTNSQSGRKQVKVLTSLSVYDGFLWQIYRKLFYSLPTFINSKVKPSIAHKKLVSVSRIIGTNIVRQNYSKLYRMDRIKFPIINYKLKLNTIKTFFKYNNYYRKMSSILSKKKQWLRIFNKNTLWKYARMLKLKVLNKTKIIITKTYNNFYITAVKKNNNVIVSYSAGCSGLTGSKRLSPLSAEKVAKKFINKFFDKTAKFIDIDIYIKAKKIDAVVRNILNILIKTKKIYYSRIFKKRILIQLIINNLILTKTYTHNGVRKRHPRRV